MPYRIPILTFLLVVSYCMSKFNGLSNSVLFLDSMARAVFLILMIYIGRKMYHQSFMKMILSNSGFILLSTLLAAVFNILIIEGFESFDYTLITTLTNIGVGVPRVLSSIILKLIFFLWIAPLPFILIFLLVENSETETIILDENLH